MQYNSLWKQMAAMSIVGAGGRGTRVCLGIYGAGFLNLSTTDTDIWLSFGVCVCGRLSCGCRMLSSVPGLHPLDAGSTTHPQSCNQIFLQTLIAKCPLGAQIASPQLRTTAIEWGDKRNKSDMFFIAL